MPADTACPTGQDLFALLAWIDPVADRFESAWRQGAIPAIADYLEGASGEARRHLLSELVKIDLEHRWRHGERPALLDYLTLWPELSEPGGEPPGDLVAHLQHLAQQYPAAPAPASAPTIPGLVLETLLGQGSFGAVYRARETGPTGRTVAVKVPRAGPLLTPAERLSFLNEASSAARLSHPAIVRILQVRHDESVPCLISECVEGPTLAERLRQGLPSPIEAAELTRQLALALQCAHANGVIHRDVKPRNVLLRRKAPLSDHPSSTEARQEDGCDSRLGMGDFEPVLTDFGLALCRGRETLTAPGAVLGTVPYMSPEQAAGQSHLVDGRSDLFSLGAVLYEMLTGTTPFDPGTPRTNPKPPRSADRRIPRDLETICVKALAAPPEERYQTAGELADDLRRFLAGEPIRARRAGWTELVARWCRNHPGVAVLSGLLLLALAGAGWLAWASSRASEAARRREVLLQRREVLLQQAQRLRLTPRADGWAEEAWRLAAAAADIRRDGDLQTEAFALLSGLDVEMFESIQVPGVSALVHDPKRPRILLAGTDAVPACLRDLGTGSILQTAQRPGAGPVAIRPDGAAVRLSRGAGGSLVLEDLAGVGPAITCSLASLSGGPAPVLRAATLAADGTLVAAVGDFPGRPQLAVWNGAGELLGRWSGNASLLALSPRGDRLAGSDSDGRLVVWAVPDGRRLAELNSGHVQVNCLAFSPDGRRLALGAGDGTLGLWEWEANLYRPCFGAEYEIYSVAFSPDGALLASGGRGTHLWDATTGVLLLQLGAGDRITALGFSPDGTTLAVSSGMLRPGLSRWRLCNGRGIATLRGLSSHVSRVRFEPSGQYVAALSHRWEVGLWERKSGRLLHRFGVRPGLSADNAALAFSADGRRFAFCAGTEACLWDVASGRLLASWPDLPPGLCDQLAFTPEGRLLLFRAETTDDRVSRFGVDPARYPRLCRLRDLLGSKPRSPLATLRRFNFRVLTSAGSDDGRWFVVEGIHAGPQGKRQELCAVDGRDGKVKWSRPITPVSNTAGLATDPHGELLLRHTRCEGQEVELIELSTGRQLRAWDTVAWALGPRADLLVARGSYESKLGPGMALVRGSDLTPLLPHLDAAPWRQPVLDLSGRALAWGNTDGTVSLCDLAEARSRLSDLGLGWPEP
jgi:WD40 repeat protein